MYQGNAAMIEAEDDVVTSSSDTFSKRHIGPSEADIAAMLSALGISSLEELADKTVPSNIRLKGKLNLPAAVSEEDVLREIENIAERNQVFRTYIGMGFHGTHTPGVILRNIMENPGWYTQYTPYQAEISQGRLEALLNFQTMISDLTALPISNSSLLDEATAAAEAMTLCHRVKGNETKNKFFVDKAVHPQNVAVMKTRAQYIGIELVEGNFSSAKIDSNFFGGLVQYPATNGEIFNYSAFAETLHSNEALLVVAADLLALTLLRAPGEFGADVCVGNTQRFGVPLGFGGPHAAFMAVKDEWKRQIPGRLVGLSKDSTGKIGYRLALQAREQHIRREKATSNICTAQVLLAIMASMYAIYHGPKGLRVISERVHSLTRSLAEALAKRGVTLLTKEFFDTIHFKSKEDSAKLLTRARNKQVNLRIVGSGVFGISLDETTRPEDIEDLIGVVCGDRQAEFAPARAEVLSEENRRTSQFLTHPVFNRYHSETEMLRYIKRLESKDLSLAASMIPLGSCTMKLNATTEMIPVTWRNMNSIHPFAPLDQVEGYIELFHSLEALLCEITGFKAVSLQPNAGSQGEYAGLLAIRAFQASKGEGQRNLCLIPASAHGTNPATASMLGMDVIVVACDSIGNVDIADLKVKAAEHSARLAALMVTYPSTHGVFEAGIKEICEIVHAHGGQVYMDGANMNAQVGLCRPADIGADVCHLNLHKTFCIPHGGGGPGVGPIGVAEHLAPFLPGHFHMPSSGSVGAVAATAWGSASILPIPWSYIRMMGAEGVTRATQVAILNANYIAKNLEPYYPCLYRGANGMVAHECILDLRGFEKMTEVKVEDVAKRLMDYSFHAPTVSFPVPGTIMVEPTESESKAELDRFIEAMIKIHAEIKEIESGRSDKVNNVLKNAPHTAEQVSSDNWNHPYSRELAAYPVPSLREFKFWPAVGRIDSAYGDRNLICSCPPMI